MAIYSRDVAVRVVDRTGALGDFSTRGRPTCRGWRALRAGPRGHRRPAGLPLVFENSGFRVYSLPAPVRFAGAVPDR